jgi:hypothetical protein
VVRRLKELGYKVTVVDSHTRSFVSYSNAVDKRIVAPSLLYNPQGFARAVIDELKREEYSFYFPVLECGFFNVLLPGHHPAAYQDDLHVL